MSRGKQITAGKLEELGAPRLAQLITEHCERDPGLRKKVRLALAAGRGAGSLAGAIDRRLSALRRSRRFLDWQESKPLRDELDSLRRAIADELAQADPPAGVARGRRTPAAGLAPPRYHSDPGCGLPGTAPPRGGGARWEALALRATPHDPALRDVAASGVRAA